MGCLTAPRVRAHRYACPIGPMGHWPCILLWFPSMAVSPLDPQVTSKCKTGGDMTDFLRVGVISIVYGFHLYHSLFFSSSTDTVDQDCHPQKATHIGVSRLSTQVTLVRVLDSNRLVVFLD